MHRDKSAIMAKWLFFAKSVLVSIQAYPYPHPRGWIELIQVYLIGFQKFFSLRVTRWDDFGSLKNFNH